MTKRKHKPTIGPISEGTFRDEDLIPRFLNEIQYIDPARITKLRKDPEWRIITNWFKNHGDEDHRGCTKRLIAHQKKTGVIAKGSKVWHQSFYYSEYTSELFDVLNELAPPYCSFGSSEGDGACFGFWPDVDSAKEGVEFVTRHTRWNESGGPGIDEPPKGFRGEWLHVSDHGNATLYYRNSKGKDREIWSVV